MQISVERITIRRKDLSLFGEERKRPKPTKALKMLVYERDKHICQLCHKEVNPLDFDIGHNIAHSKGGSLNLRNAVLLHPSCNRSMQTLSIKQARKVMGLPETPEELAKKSLGALSLAELKYLAKNHRIKLKGRVEEGILSSRVVAPSKRQYINALAKIPTDKQVEKEIARMPRPEKKRKPKKKQSGWSLW